MNTSALEDKIDDMIVEHLERTNVTSNHDDYLEKYEFCRVALTRTLQKRDIRMRSE